MLRFLQIISTFMMMKKLFVGILAFLYLGLSSGIALNVHYCMNKISSIDLFAHKEKCSKCGMKTEEDCCKNQLKIIKLKDSHTLSSNDIHISLPVAFVQHSYAEANCYMYFSESSITLNSNSPPEPSGRTLCISNCVFRI